MPPAKRKTAAKPAAKRAPKAARPKPAAKSAAKSAAAKPAAKAAPTANPPPAFGNLPLKSRTIWLIDTETAAFTAARRREVEALQSGDADRDGMQFAEGLFVDKGVQKWWT